MGKLALSLYQTDNRICGDFYRHCCTERITNSKLTAYIFILIASIVLLAHAVIPHHHHHQQVCVERTDCIGNDGAHTHNSPESDHQRGCNTDSYTCVLKQAYVIPSSQGRILKDCENCSNTHNHDFYILANFGYSDLKPVSKDVALIPKLPPSLTSFVTITPGLRAPPIV